MKHAEKLAPIAGTVAYYVHPISDTFQTTLAGDRSSP